MTTKMPVCKESRCRAEFVVDGWICVPCGKSSKVASSSVTVRPMSSAILQEAANIVAGARNTTHGEKERSFTAIATLWNAYLSIRKEPDSAITPYDVAQMMSLLKKARASQGTLIKDHFIDDAGYAAIAGEIGLDKDPPT